MDLQVKPMRELTAQIICEWKYDSPYDLYNFNRDDYNELMSGSYHVIMINGEVIGFICYQQAAQVPMGHKKKVYADLNYTDIGLGLRPDLCGKGIGKDVLLTGMNYGSKLYNKSAFRITVATFNKRAITLYQKLGFEVITCFDRQEPKHEEFLVMGYELHD